MLGGCSSSCRTSLTHTQVYKHLESLGNPSLAVVMTRLRSSLRIHTEWMASITRVMKKTPHATHYPNTPSTHSTPKWLEGRRACPASQPSSTHEGYSHARWTPQYSTDGREDTGHRMGREMSQGQHNRKKKHVAFFHSKTDDCWCQHAVEKKNRGRDGDGSEGVNKWKKKEKLSSMKQIWKPS